MSTTSNTFCTWLRQFKNVWLPQTLAHDIPALHSVTAKLVELEQMVLDTSETNGHVDDEEYYRAKLLQDHSSSSSDTEQTLITSTHKPKSLEGSLPTPPDVQQSFDDENEEEQAKQMLLEQSDEEQSVHEPMPLSEDDGNVDQSRPSIRLKRLTQEEIKEYLPIAKPHSQRQSETNTDRPPSKTRTSTNENSDVHRSADSNATSSDSDGEIRIRTRLRKSTRAQSRGSSTKEQRHSRNRNQEAVISYQPPTTVNESSSNDSLPIVDEVMSTHDEAMLDDPVENIESESIVVPMETNLNQTIETTTAQPEVEKDSTDVAESSSIEEDSTSDRPLAQVPSYAHLLDRSSSSSSSSSSSVSEKEDDDQRLAKASSNSETSPTKTKQKNKTALKKRVLLSSFSSSSDENDKTLTPDKHDKNATASRQPSPMATDGTSPPIRAQIRRSSSSSSNASGADQPITPNRTRRCRKTSSTSNERSSILKQMKRKTEEKRTTMLELSSSGSDAGDQIKTKKSKPTLTDDDEDEAEEEEGDDDDDEDEDGLSPSKRQAGSQGRKNIRKIIDDKELDVQTKEAIEAERERRQRIADKQKEYNETLLEQSQASLPTTESEPNSGSTARLILELDKITNEPLIEVSPRLVEHLKPHQCDGVRFLWNNVFESINSIEKKKKKHSGNGCILAHCMGLGKTLQVISFLHTVLNAEHLTKVRTCLVLCPINAALNWTNEFEFWLKGIQPSVDHYQLATVKANLRVSHLSYWYKNGGVIIMGYEMYRRLASGIGIKNKKSKTDAFQCLVDPGPDIIIADEGHILKNAQTALAKCLSNIKTSRRVVLTGTPLQNNLIEYYCMVSFIKPNLLGSQQEYINRFVNPIQNGQHRDSNEDDVRLMKRRACVLHELLTGFVDRKDYFILKEYLPPKFEYIINIRMSDLQSALYEIYLKREVNDTQRSSLKKDFKSAKLFADYQYLQKIWTHPFLLYPQFIDHWKKRLNKDADDLIDDNEIEAMFEELEEEEFGEKTKKKKSLTVTKDDGRVENSFRGFMIENIEDETKDMKPPSCQSAATDGDSAESVGDDDDIEVIKTYPTRSRTVESNRLSQTCSSSSDVDQPGPSTEKPDEEPWLDEMREQFWFPFLDMLPDESQFDIELSGKFLLLKSILDKCADIGDKVLLFTRSIYTLNYIERFLHQIQRQNELDYQKQCESRRQLRDILSNSGNEDQVTNAFIPEPIEWARDRDYFRMDGQTDVTLRKRYAKAFNDPANPRARLFLISTLAGGIGINLTGSNRVIVFDASWNPSHDTQAIFRSYRFGQKKPVYIYRFLARGTMEEKIYQRQVVKQSLSQRVVDDHQLDRHFTQSDIKELYKFHAKKLPETQSNTSLFTDTNEAFNYPIPKDHLLLDLLYEHHRWIHSYHSHDSLLENRLDEGLTADERRRALEEYENLKRVPDPRQLAMQRFQQQQQLNLMIAHQQKLMIAAAAAAGHRMPNGNAQQTRSDILQGMPGAAMQDPNYMQLLQMMTGMTPDGQSNPQPRPNKPIQKRPAPQQPRPTTNGNANDVILLDSDEEMAANDVQSTIPE